MADNLMSGRPGSTFAGVAVLIAGAYNALRGFAALSDDDTLAARCRRCSTGSISPRCDATGQPRRVEAARSSAARTSAASCSPVMPAVACTFLVPAFTLVDTRSAISGG